MTVSIDLTEKPIEVEGVVAQVSSTAAGAVVLFLGTVREFTAGRRTIALDYEAYPTMAVRVMQQIADEAVARWPVTHVAILHRTGRLEPGEVSVATAVSSPHRAAAFEAGRYLIEELKQRVPIWKQENWENGETEWVAPPSTTASPTGADNAGA